MFSDVVIVAHRDQVTFPVPPADEHGIRKDLNLIRMIQPLPRGKKQKKTPLKQKSSVTP